MGSVGGHDYCKCFKDGELGGQKPCAPLHWSPNAISVQAHSAIAALIEAGVIAR